MERGCMETAVPFCPSQLPMVPTPVQQSPAPHVHPHPPAPFKAAISRPLPPSPASLAESSLFIFSPRMAFALAAVSRANVFPRRHVSRGQFRNSIQTE